MPDDPTQQTGQEPGNETSPSAGTTASTRGIDSFPEEAQDYIRRLRAENAKHRTDLKERETRLKEFEDAGKSAAEKLEEDRAAAEGRATSAETKLLRFEVAAEKGLPLSLAGRLQGSTKEELSADADKLKQDFGITDDGGVSAGGSGFDGGVRRPVRRPKTMNGLISQAARR